MRFETHNKPNALFVAICLLIALTGILLHAQEDDSATAPAAESIVSETASADTAAQSAPQAEAEAPAPEVTQNAEAAPHTISEKLKAILKDLTNAIEEIFNFQQDITLTDLGVSFLIVLIAFVGRHILAKWVFARLHFLAKRTKTDWDDQVLTAMEPPMAWFIFVLGAFLAVMQLSPSDILADWTLTAFKVGSLGLFFWALIRMVDVVANILTDISNKKKSSVGAFMPLIRKATRFFLIMVAIIVLLDNMNINIGSILATLGLGGAALAFAAKDTIANLYGSMALALDRPFKVGDWIMVGDKVDGDVEEIGLRSTKVRTWPKTIMSIPNSVLANEYINNWSRMPKRRVKQYVGVTYETSPEDMEGLVEDIRKLLREDEGVQQDFILVNFTDFGASSLDILVYYFTVSTAWLVHMDVRQRINLKIMRAIEARGLSVAFPTRTLYFEGDIAKTMAGQNASSQGKLPGDFGPDSPP